VREALRRDGAVWLLLAVPALLPFARLAELPLVIGALLGAIAMLRGRIDWRAPASRLALGLFACYWLPELVSAPDSVAPGKSWGEVAADLRFLPFLLFAPHAVRDARQRRLLLLGVGILLLFWCLDALLQAASGWSLGGPAQGDRLSGIFGDDNLKLGGVVAVLAPFALLPAAVRFGVRGFAAAFLPILIVVLLAGARAAWVVLAIGSALVLWQHYGARRGGLALAAALGCALIAGVVANSVSPRFAERIDRTAAALGGDMVELDYALAGRLPIWRTAFAMSLAHPINGVGVRGFRYAYPQHAAPDDPWVDLQQDSGALHAHQLLLDLSSETGAIGLLCWLFGIGLAWRAWRAAGAVVRARAAAPAYALAAMLFPLNTHYAVYSTFWSLLLFALLALWIALLQNETRSDPAS
jgi:O-antigen ligase